MYRYLTCIVRPILWLLDMMITKYKYKVQIPICTVLDSLEALSLITRQPFLPLRFGGK